MELSEKHMDLVTKTQLRDLLKNGGGPVVTIQMPTARKGYESQQNTTRFKNLLREAEGRLAEQGVRPQAIDDILGPARSRLTDRFFWQYQSDGLAMFLGPERSFSYRLPLSFEERVSVLDRPCVKPLLPILAGDGRFYVLALTQRRVRLLQGTQFTIAELSLENAPTSLAEILQYDDFERSVQFHTGAGGPSSGKGRPAVFHGQGAAADDTNLKREMMMYFRHVDNGVRDVLAEEHVPLVLAGGETPRGMYREANHYKYLLDQDIECDPAQLTPRDLHDRAWELVKPLFDEGRRAAVGRFLHLSGTEDPKAAQSIGEILPKARFQRVDTLLIPSDRILWGRFDPKGPAVEVHEDRQPGDEDLLDCAAYHTLRYGGSVHLLEPSEMPEGVDVAAICR
jgi:hypothetical protein